MNHNKKLAKCNLPLIFKKVADNSKELNLYLFKKVIEKLGLLMFED